MTARDVVVLELSRFMLEDTPRVGGVGWSPRVAVVTNVYANHLDRHGGTMAGYEGAKKNILRFQRAEDVAILNGDHEVVSSWGELARGRLVKFSVEDPGGRLEMLIPGAHNQSNAAAAMAVVGALEERGVKVGRAAAVAAIEGFTGLSHRLALVHSVTVGSGRVVKFYNDSKATSPDASMTALRAFDKGSAIFLVGGYDKHVDMSGFEEELGAACGGCDWYWSDRRGAGEGGFGKGREAGDIWGDIGECVAESEGVVGGGFTSCGSGIVAWFRELGSICEL